MRRTVVSKPVWNFPAKLPPAILAAIIFGVTLGCSGTSTTPGTPAGNSAAVVLPLGAAIPGATLAGPLAGKTLYYLGGNFNRSGCWQDSEFWDGTTLWYALTSYDSTHALTGSLVANTNCVLPSGHKGAPLLNAYSATLQGTSAWNTTNLAVNTGTTSIGAPKISGNMLAYVSYEKAGAGYGNIYLTNQSGSNTWSTPVAFSQNSANYDEDNPDIYAKGTQMIFESGRTVADGSAGAADSVHQKLWSSTLTNGAWGLPVPVSGAPASGTDSTQPWVDESTGKLYWTGGDTTTCGGAYFNCVLEADPQGSGWSNTAQVIITPTSFVPNTGASVPADGQLVLIGQFTQANGYALASCGVATLTDPTDQTATLLAGRWTVTISACVIPLN